MFAVFNPLLVSKNKFTILQALTSNAGSQDFQTKTVDGTPLYKEALKTALHYTNSDRLMYMVSATKAEYLTEIRAIVPDAFLLVPCGRARQVD